MAFRCLVWVGLSGGDGAEVEFAGQSRRVSEALMFGRNTSAQPEK